MAGIAELSGVYSIAVSSDGAFVYATSYNQDAVLVFQRDAVDGTLSHAVSFIDEVDVDSLDAAISVAASPDGRSVYVLSSGDGAVTQLDRDLATGTHTVGQIIRQSDSGMSWISYPNQLTVSPDGGVVYVASTSGSSIGIFARNRVTGLLTYADRMQNGVGGVSGISWPSSVVVSPDNLNVYAVARLSDSLAVFGRQLGPPGAGRARGERCRRRGSRGG